MRALVWLVVAGCGFSPEAGSSDARRTPDGAVGGDGAIGGDGASGDAPASPARRKAITIHGAQIAGTQANFPVWIDLTDSDIAARARTDGSDIFFTAADGTPLDAERTLWNGSAMKLDAWVRVPALVHGTDTLIYVEYGDAALATPPSPRGVFGSGFAAVWHLDDSLASTAIEDSTGLTPGTASGLAGSAQVTAQLGGGIAFDGQSTAQIAFANPLLGSGASTISVWVNQQAANHTASIVAMGSNGSEQARFLYGGYASTSSIGAGKYNDDWRPGTDLVGSGWVMLDWVVEGGTSKNSHLYINGNEISGSPHQDNAAPATVGTTGLIGNAPSPSFGSPNGMAGTIDELRLATVARDKTWITTEYINQSAPTAFYGVGPEQPVP